MNSSTLDASMLRTQLARLDVMISCSSSIKPRGLTKQGNVLGTWVSAIFVYIFCPTIAY